MESRGGIPRNPEIGNTLETASRKVEKLRPEQTTSQNLASIHFHDMLAKRSRGPRYKTIPVADWVRAEKYLIPTSGSYAFEDTLTVCRQIPKRNNCCAQRSHSCLCITFQRLPPPEGGPDVFHQLSPKAFSMRKHGSASCCDHNIRQQR